MISKKETVSETKHKNQKLVSFSESVEYNMEKVDKESAYLDDTLELNEPSEESESKVDFRPPDLEQIEKNVGQTIEEIRKIGSDKHDKETEDSDSLVK